MSRKNSDQAAPKRLELRLHAPFFAPGADKEVETSELLAFHEVCCEARELSLLKKSKALELDEQRFEEIRSILEKTFEVWQSTAGKQTDIEAAQQRMREICPDKETQTKVVEFLAPAIREQLRMTDEERAAKERELAEKQLELERNQELLNATETFHTGLEIVAKHVYGGSTQAIKDALSIAEGAITLLMISERMHSEATRKVAAGQLHWPVLASTDKGWEGAASQRVQRLQLGRNLECVRAGFRDARGTDENYPARRWAKAAVRALEETRLRFLVFRQYHEEFRELGESEKMVLTSPPEWTGRACQLPAFSATTAGEWGKVIREMIREQVPDFHFAPEWSPQRNSAKHNCRDSRGEIQCAILDDIVSALHCIAPPPKVPKLDC